MSFSVIAVFLVTTRVFVQSHNNEQTTTVITPTSTTEPPPTTTTAAPALPLLSTWIYIGSGIGVAVLLIVCQTLFFFLYIRKLKSSQTRRSINKMAPLNSQKEHSDRYQRVPSRVNPHIAKPAEDQHSSSLYEYECVKDITGKDRIKPEPPPTSTLPKRNRPPLPLPNVVHGPKSSTLTAHSTQQLIQQRGRQVSTVPSKPPNFNLHVPLPPRSPQTRRLPTPVRTPVLKPRDMTKNDRSHKIYESLPDLRPGRHPQMLPVARPPLILTPPTPSINPDLNRTRRLHGNGTPSPILQPKLRFPLPQEFNRNGYPPKPIDCMMGSSRIYESLPDVRDFKYNRKPAIALPPPVSLTPAKPSAVSNLNRCRRIPVNSQSPNTSSPALPRRTPFPLPPRTAPKPKYTAESSDDEDWTIEEIKPMNMYNV